MTFHNNAVKLVATDRIKTRNGIKTIACELTTCPDSATYTHFFADGSVVRRCGYHNPKVISMRGFAYANHAAIVVRDVEVGK